MMKSYTILLLIVFISIHTIRAQSVKMLGGVIDSQSKAPLENVTISFSKGTTGTASNKDGKFVLIFDDGHKSDSIRFSRIGYEEKTIAVSNVLPAEGSIVFELQPILKEIEQINVRHRSIPEILKSAIETTNELIARNTVLDVYYREFAYLDNDLFKFSDAALYYEIKSGDKRPKIEIFVVESRVVKDSLTHDQKWKSDIESLIETDKAVKLFYNVNYLERFVGKNYQNYFDFLLGGDDDVLKLEIYPKAEIEKFLPSAIVYIDQYTNQILRADYGYDSHLQYMPSINILVLKYAVRKDWATNIYNTGDQVFLRYSKVTQDIDFKVGKKSGLLRSNVEVLVSNMNVDPSALSGLVPFKKATISHNGNSYNSPFWDDRIVILATEDEIKVVNSNL